MHDYKHEFPVSMKCLLPMSEMDFRFQGCSLSGVFLKPVDDKTKKSRVVSLSKDGGLFYNKD